MSYLPYVCAVWLFAAGIYGVATSRNLVHLVQCLNIAQSSSYLLLLSIGFRHNATAPIFVGVPQSARATDPIVQALTLTDIVVSITISALLLAISMQFYRRTGSLDPVATRELRG